MGADREANAMPVQLERRGDPRIPVDEEATLDLLEAGSRLRCRIIEISLTGCRLRLLDRFMPGARGGVEASFTLRGASFRFAGAIEWTGRGEEAGIAFSTPHPRRRDELVEVLCVLAAEQAARAVKQAAERLAAEEARAQAAQEMAARPSLPSLGEGTGAAQETPRVTRSVAGPLSPSKPAAPVVPAKPSGRERRNQSRHDIDATATILLVNLASRITGRILNLSLGGCRIRTAERFPVGIYTRVETEFHLEGLPFRLGGVVQAVQDRQSVGIRFLDMSARKREQLELLIGELDELREERADTDPGGSGNSAR